MNATQECASSVERSRYAIDEASMAIREHIRRFDETPGHLSMLRDYTSNALERCIATPSPETLRALDEHRGDLQEELANVRRALQA